MNGLETNRISSLFEAVTCEQPVDVPAEPMEMVKFREYQKTDAYSKLSHEAKNKLRDELFEQAFMQEYLEKKWKAQLHNRDCVLWMVEYRDNHNPSEAEQSALNIKISLFLRKIGNQLSVYEALRLKLSDLKIAHLKSILNDK